MSGFPKSSFKFLLVTPLEPPLAQIVQILAMMYPLPFADRLLYCFDHINNTNYLHISSCKLRSNNNNILLLTLNIITIRLLNTIYYNIVIDNRNYEIDFNRNYICMNCHIVLINTT